MLEFPKPAADIPFFNSNMFENEEVFRNLQKLRTKDHGGSLSLHLVQMWNKPYGCGLPFTFSAVQMWIKVAMRVLAWGQSSKMSFAGPEETFDESKPNLEKCLHASGYTLSDAEHRVQTHDLNEDILQELALRGSRVCAALMGLDPHVQY